MPNIKVSKVSKIYVNSHKRKYMSYNVRLYCSRELFKSKTRINIL